jgi:DNA-3-methyladenine glycosylase
MPPRNRLPRDFYARDTVQVARELLGTHLVRLDNGQRLGGVILETEAYHGEADLGCHARAGRTPRTQVMYGLPGHAYVYFTYGMHWMLNFVTQPDGFPAAVLIRAILPLEGREVIAARRSPQPPQIWTDGPAKLCKALGIDGNQHGVDLCSDESEIYVEEGVSIPDARVEVTARVGLESVPEPWRSMPWRFRVSESAVMGEL